MARVVILARGRAAKRAQTQSELLAMVVSGLGASALDGGLTVSSCARTHTFGRTTPTGSLATNNWLERMVPAVHAAASVRPQAMLVGPVTGGAGAHAMPLSVQLMI